MKLITINSSVVLHTNLTGEQFSKYCRAVDHLNIKCKTFPAAVTWVSSTIYGEVLDNPGVERAWP